MVTRIDQIQLALFVYLTYEKTLGRPLLEVHPY